MAAKARLKDDVWFVFVNHHGKRMAKQVGPGTSGKKLADTLAKQWNAALTLGHLDKVFPVKVRVSGELGTVRELWPGWLSDREKAGELRGGSGLAYTSVMKTHVYPVIGDLPCDQVTREQLGAIIRKAKTAGRSRSIIGHILKAVRGFFRDLKENKLIATSPADDLTYFVGKGLKRGEKVEIFSQDECRVLLQAAKEVAPRLFPLIAMALGTGARSGELLGLVKDDIDLKPRNGHAGHVTIRTSWSRNTKKLLPPKNGEPRMVPLSKELVVILKDWFATRAAEGWGQEQIVFTGPENRRVKTWHQRWSTLLKRAGIPYRRFHACRHSFASHALRAGVRPELVQLWMGHQDLTLTLNVYRDFIPSREADARDAAKLGELIAC